MPQRHSTSRTPQPVGRLKQEVEQVERVVETEQRRLERIPLLLPLLATFGLVATFYGFEHILDQTTLVNHPWIMSGVGILLLLLTGAAARKL